MKTLRQRLAAAAAIFAFAFNAHAAIGSASASDVTLDGAPADAFASQAGWNPHAGPNGDTSGFGTAFDGAFGSGPFDLLDKYDHDEDFGNAGPLTFTFTEDTGTNGTWSVTNTSATNIVSRSFAAQNVIMPPSANRVSGTTSVCMPKRAASPRFRRCITT